MVIQRKSRRITQIDGKLVGRFMGVLNKDDYPHINPFLTFMYLWYEAYTKQEAFPDVLDRRYVGDGGYIRDCIM
jgi:hypothetical protein